VPYLRAKHFLRRVPAVPLERGPPVPFPEISVPPGKTRPEGIETVLSCSFPVFPGGTILQACGTILAIIEVAVELVVLMSISKKIGRGS